MSMSHLAALSVILALTLPNVVRQAWKLARIERDHAAEVRADEAATLSAHQRAEAERRRLRRRRIHRAVLRGALSRALATAVLNAGAVLAGFALVR